jgi:hypothetical protein
MRTSGSTERTVGNLVLSDNKGVRLSPFITFAEVAALKELPVSFTLDGRPFYWNNITVVADERLRTSMNSLRAEYSVFLLKKLRNKNVCKFEEVGTVSDRSYASDIDVNLVCPLSKRTLSAVVESTLNVFRNVEVVHAKYFDTPLHLLFDFNMYATDFFIGKEFIDCKSVDCLMDPITSNDRQKLWAGLRMIEYVEQNRVAIPAFFKDFAAQAHDFHKGLRIGNKPYVHYVTRFFEYAVEKGGKLDVLFERFSQSKIRERETYRSVGAFLHIVMTKHALHPSFYEDSLLDNFGFALESIGKKQSPWTSGQRERVCKYINRMCAACLIIKSDDERVRKIESITSKVNSNRKALITNNKDILRFYVLIGYDEITSKAAFIKRIFEELRPYFEACIKKRA